MKALAVFAVLLGAIALYSLQPQLGQSDESAQTIATNYVVYRNAAITYAVNNPVTTGTLTPAMLGLPSDWRALRIWQNRVEGNTLYVYGTASSQEIVAVQNILKGSFAVGVNQNNHLVTSHGTCVALPSFIPEGNLTTVISVR
ncbi:type IV pilus biogenesis protein PilM [Halodesulfovibrio marinisediminis]|uniref:PilM protein n=1 Tax=Halodesulfovibrio marinisediminis DSM 17456 TaxID=1121457 RepID=A0A1N6FE92_9BACT|nr:type IV pilus biogenesis protein PilM [Halodesulfovibrio marinisediminis]SIN93575.1 PilM protein [Halodesulfovibrio marinisediminis DSM 17456]